MSISEAGNEALKIIEKETSVTLDSEQRSKLFSDFFTYRCLADAKYKLEQAKASSEELYYEKLFNTLTPEARTKAIEKYGEQFARVRLAEVISKYLDEDEEYVDDPLQSAIKQDNERSKVLKEFGKDPNQVLAEKIEFWAQEFLSAWSQSIKKCRGTASQKQVARSIGLTRDQWRLVESGRNTSADNWIDVLFASGLGGGFLRWFDPSNGFHSNFFEKLDYESMRRVVRSRYVTESFHESAPISEMILSEWHLDECDAELLNVDRKTIGKCKKGNKALIILLLKARARNWRRYESVDDWRGMTIIDWFQSSLRFARMTPNDSICYDANDFPADDE